MDVEALIKEYLATAQFMHIATSRNDQPWVSTVYYAADIDMNLYWMSKQSRRHSQEIAHNSKVAGTIVLPHNYGDKVRGVQFEGEARELKGEELNLGVTIYSRRYWIVEERAGSDTGPDPHICYQIKPKLFILFDEVNFPGNPQQELRL